MRIVVCPAAIQVVLRESIRSESQTVCRIRIRHMSDRVVTAPRLITAVLDEIDIVPETGHPDHILEVMPGHAAKRPRTM